jgi:hypothetical protein
LTALEYTVADLEPCLQLFVGLLGLELVDRARHPALDAEVARISAGSVMINLLCPTDTGMGRPFPNPERRMSQLTFGLGSVTELAELGNSLAEAGAAVVERDEALSYIDADMIKGLLGTDAAMVFCVEEAEEVRWSERDGAADGRDE